ncbi:MAG: hypothetical protein PHH08_03145 [Candidatus ainarchaeum sp.]|nr:hypothetical protein [Candidatus ainarchaeum sp.]
MSILAIFKDSLVLLGKQPKLFAPKIIVAFLYGIIMLVMAQFTLFFLAEFSSGALSDPVAIIVFDLALMLGAFIVFFIDVFTNAMYPEIIRDFFDKKPISFGSAALSIKDKIIKIFLSIIFIEFLLTAPFSLILAGLLLTNNRVLVYLFIILFLVVYLALAAIFYFAYPVLVLGENFFLKFFSESFRLSSKKMPKILVFSFVPFFISIISFVLAFLARDPAFLLLFIVMRFLMALLQTYHMVLNPSIFLKYDQL